VGTQFAAGFQAPATDAEGRFRATDLDATPMELEIQPLRGEDEPHGHYVTTRVGPVRPGTHDVRIELEVGREISGRLLDADGRPVTSPVHLTAVRITEHGNPDYAQWRRMRVQNDEGAFRLRGLPTGDYHLAFEPEEKPEDGERSALTSTALSGVAAGASGLTVWMVEGASIAGRIVDERGEPVERKGTLYVYPEGAVLGGPGTVIVPVDGKATFRTPPLELGRGYAIFATHFERHMQATVGGLVAGDADVVLKLPRAGRITGLVLDEDGDPVGYGVPVHASANGVEPGTAGSAHIAYTTAGGAFTLDGLGPHTFDVAAGGGDSGLLSAGQARGVRLGKRDVVLRVRKGVVVTGRLLDDQGRPFRTHYLAARPVAAKGPVVSAWTRVSDEDGRFTLRGVAPGKVEVSCYRGEVYVQLGEIDAPAEDVELTVPPE
jgi:hypothetical protein